MKNFHIINVINLLILITLFFIYTFEIHFFFLPFNTNLLIGIFTFLFVILYNIRKEQFFINVDYLYIIILYMLLIANSLVSLIYNGTQEFYLIKNSLLNVLVIFTAYFMVCILRKRYTFVSFELISNFYIIVILIQILLSILFFLKPEIYNNISTILSNDVFLDERIKELLNRRLVGLGTHFFGAGVIYSFTLLLIVAMVKRKSLFPKITFLYMIVYIIVFLCGMMTSRTTIIGFILSFPLLFLIDYKIGIKFIFVLTIVIVFIYFMFNDIKEKFESIIFFGFDLIINYIENGKLANSSLDGLKTMINFPDEIKTWLIGDGYLTHPINKSLYYKETDIGYNRLIYFFGIFGCLLYLSINIFISFLSYKKNCKEYKYFFIATFFLFLIVNLKGLASISWLLYPFLFVDHKKNNEIEK